MSDPVFEANSIADSNARNMARLPEVVVYEHKGWVGRELRTNLNVRRLGDVLNNTVSSIVVVGGTWEFFSGLDYGGSSKVLKMGYYNLHDIGLPNDSISSFKCISFD